MALPSGNQAGCREELGRLNTAFPHLFGTSSLLASYLQAPCWAQAHDTEWLHPPCPRDADRLPSKAPSSQTPAPLLFSVSLYANQGGETCPLHFKTAVRKVQGDFCVDHHSSVSGKVLGGLLWMAASPAIVVCHCHTRHSISMSPLFTHHGQDHAEGCS